MTRKLNKQFYKIFKKAIKGNYDYVYVVNPLKTQENYFRAIGKTTTLIKLANKYNLPIYYRFFATQTHIQHLCSLLKLKTPTLHNISDKEFANTKGRRSKTILIDEDVNVDDIKKLETQDPTLTIVGFTRINFKNK